MDQDNNASYAPGVSNSNLYNESGEIEGIPENVRDKEEIVAVALYQGQSPNIYKLPLNLLAATFDYLSLEDLCAIRQTSKWFRKVAGFCYHKNYSAFERSIYRFEHKELNAINDLIRAVHVVEADHLKMHEYYHDGRSEFQQLKRLRLSCIDLRDVRPEDVKKIVGEIEHLEIGDCEFSESFADAIPSVFPNLKHLTMFYTTNWKLRSEWFGYEYPNLERFELSCQVEDLEMRSFLEMNPNIRKIALDASCVWNSRESMKSLKLEDLAIQIPMELRKKPFFPSDSFCQFLNELHDLGSFKRLKVYISYYYYKHKDQFIELSSLHALSKLHLLNIWYEMDFETNHKYADRFELSMFKTLEEFRVPLSSLISDIELAADNLENLERIRFDFADLDDIEVFIKRSRTLTKIKVKYFVRDASFIRKTNERIIYNNIKVTEFVSEKQNVINLSKLNAARANLQDAKPVTLYVTEEVYLATKWAMKETDFEFIQLRRHEFFHWDDDFAQFD